jgi:hypothetical protein
MSADRGRWGMGVEPLFLGPGDTESGSLFTVIQAAEQILELRATLHMIL